MYWYTSFSCKVFLIQVHTRIVKSCYWNKGISYCCYVDRQTSIIILLLLDTLSLMINIFLMIDIWLSAVSSKLNYLIDNYQILTCYRRIYFKTSRDKNLSISISCSVAISKKLWLKRLYFTYIQGWIHK